jgi:hypothetical protein
MKMEKSKPVFISTNPPRPPRDFVGRKFEIGTYLSILKKRQTKFLGIHGMAGVGKTTLALQLVKELFGEYDSTYIYIDLGITVSGRTPLFDSMLPVISYFNSAASIPQQKDEIIALYRSVLYRKSGIIVLDNAQTPGQVLPLIPFSEHIVIIVSRQNFTLPNLYSRTLDVFTPLEARELIIKIAPKLNDVADELARICEYLPLAVKLAANFHKSRVDMSPYDFINQMSTLLQSIKTNDVYSRFDKDMLTNIRTSIDISYKLLNQELKRLWCMLSSIPGDFNKSTVQTVWNLDPDSTQLFLSKLASHNMLAWVPNRSVYHLHQFLRLYAAAHLKDHK